MKEKIINMPIEVCNRQIANRVVFQPMEGCDGELDGSIGPLTYRRYMRFAESGAGIIWFEAVAVDCECRANPRQLFLNEKTKDSFKILLQDMRKRAIELFGIAPCIVMQMTNSGRFSKPNGYPEPIIAYHNKLWEKGKEDLPYAIATENYCNKIIANYADSTKLAVEVGFDGIDVKCCHGYLFNEFLSAYDRDDEFGGSLKNRTRLYFACIDKVRENLSKDMFVTTRFNACDCFPYPYGYGVDSDNNIDLTETKEIIRNLQSKGIELINLTLGNPYLIPHVNRPCMKAPESGEVGMKRIYNVTKELQKQFPEIKFVMSGLSYESENCIDYAETMLEENVANLVGFGRMTFAYPEFYQDYLNNGILDKKKCCLKCSKCTELMRHGSVTGCPIRDKEVYMPYYNKYVLNKEI
jgi:2,4-dienoyl-CoA reductase-like NADH-dependent reductase (Old Yellow Enzyme family)